jgi:hypothetical protein
MAQARKPKGIIDDIGKAIAKAVKAGKTDEVARLRSLQNTYMNDAARMKAGTNELRRQWSNRAGRSMHAEKAAETATSKARRIREEGRVRGIQQKSRALGVKEQANPRAAAEKAYKQVEKRKAVRAAGGVNSPKRVQARRAKRGAK